MFYFLLGGHCQYWFEISTGHKWNKHLENEKKLLALLAPQTVLNKARSKVFNDDCVLKYEKVLKLNIYLLHLLKKKK